MPRTAARLARVVATLLLPASLLTATAMAASPARADGPGSGTPYVVTLGDSYIAGEAGRWAGNSNDGESLIDAGGSAAYFDNAGHTAETIARCHRSNADEVYLGGGVSGMNLACSGAKTATFTNSSGYFKPGIDFYSSGSNQGQALMLQTFATSHNVKAVTISIGGNDFGFADIVTDCVEDFLLSSSLDPDYCKDDSAATSAMAAANVSAVRARIATAFQNVRTAMRNAGYADTAWTLVVQTYPSPIPASSAFRYKESGYTRQSTGGCGFWNADADYSNNTIVPTINGALTGAEADSGLTNVKTLNVTNAFVGRRLCENTVGLVEEEGLSSWRSAGAVDKTEWINQIRTVSTATTDYYIQESIHPNYWGQLALRNCLRQAYNGGSPRSGTCSHGTGLNSNGEPNMTLN
ncbi:MAG: hypothetical protein J2O46_05680 [Nocardioides sp.]|nr:hypothetical protein [Nocardioides sp.]